MSKALAVMTEKQPEKTKEIIERKLNPKWIKQRKGRVNKTLDYIEGHRVIMLLNEAFDYKWSFEVLEKQTVAPQKGYPYIEILGQLTIPGVGVKQAYGSKSVVGDPSQCAKAAATDALKKAASLVGIGLELWSDDELYEDNNNSGQNNNYSQNQQNNQGNENNFYEAYKNPLNSDSFYSNYDLSTINSSKSNRNLNNWLSLRNYRQGVNLFV